MAGRIGVLAAMRILQWLPVGLIFINSANVNANADSVDVVGGLSMGYTVVEFPAKLDSEPTYPSYLLSGSASYDQFYVSYAYTGSLTDATISEEEDIGEASRSDQDLSIGYHLNKSVSLFMGYKNSETHVDFRLRDSDTVRDERYQQNGFFAGLSYGYTFKNRSRLNLSLAYVDLKTDNRFLSDIEDDEEESEDESDILEFDDLEGRVSGDAEGYSAGISWIMPLSQSLAFNAAYKVNDYKETIKFEGERYTADSTVTLFTIGLLKVF